MTSNKFTLYAVLIFVFSVTLHHELLYGSDNHQIKQTSDSLAIRIEFISSISSTDDFPGATDFSSKLFDFFFGPGDQRLIRPMSVISSNDGTIFVADQGSNSIALINNNKGTIELKPFFPSLVGICFYEENSFLFTDSRLGKIFLQRDISQDPVVLNDSLLLDQPTGIAYSTSKQQIWVTETGSHRISVLDKKGKFLRHIGKRGTAPGEFNYPTFIWIDKNEWIYVVDAMNFRVQILDINGEIKIVFGQAGDGSGDFSRPKGIATDSYGNIYVVDALFHTVQVFNISGQFLYNFGRQGREKGEFWMPTGIYINTEDKIFVADSYNSRIQIFQLIQRN